MVADSVSIFGSTVFSLSFSCPRHRPPLHQNVHAQVPRWSPQRILGPADDSANTHAPPATATSLRGRAFATTLAILGETHVARRSNIALNEFTLALWVLLHSHLALPTLYHASIPRSSGLSAYARSHPHCIHYHTMASPGFVARLHNFISQRYPVSTPVRTRCTPCNVSSIIVIIPYARYSSNSTSWLCAFASRLLPPPLHAPLTSSAPVLVFYDQDSHTLCPYFSSSESRCVLVGLGVAERHGDAGPGAQRCTRPTGARDAGRRCSSPDRWERSTLKRSSNTERMYARVGPYVAIFQDGTTARRLKFPGDRAI